MWQCPSGLKVVKRRGHGTPPTPPTPRSLPRDVDGWYSQTHIVTVQPTHRADPKSGFWWVYIYLIIYIRYISNYRIDLTPPQGTFLLLDAPALAFAAALLHLRYAPLPLYEPADVVTSALLPVVTTAIDGLWVAALCVFHLVSVIIFVSDPAMHPDGYSTFTIPLLSFRNQLAS